jgi:hypothetical protein
MWRYPGEKRLQARNTLKELIHSFAIHSFLLQGPLLKGLSVFLQVEALGPGPEGPPLALSSSSPGQTAVQTHASSSESVYRAAGVVAPEMSAARTGGQKCRHASGHHARAPIGERVEVIARAIGGDFEPAELVVEVADAAHERNELVEGIRHLQREQRRASRRAHA